MGTENYSSEQLNNEAINVATIKAEKTSVLLSDMNTPSEWSPGPRVNMDKPDTVVSQVTTQPVLDYVTAAQGRIFINGILVDECYDIHYMYKEAKEPIYGYLSKHWDAVLPGTVIVYGGFTINYRHDSYLYAILSKATAGSVTGQIQNIKDTNAKELSFKQQLMKYRAAQIELQEAKSKFQYLQGKLIEEEALNHANEEGAMLAGVDLDNKLEETIAARDEFWNTFDATYKDELETKIVNFTDSIEAPAEDGKSGPGIDSLQTINTSYTAKLKTANEELSRQNMIVGELFAKIGHFEMTLRNLSDLLKKTSKSTSSVKYAAIEQEITKTEALKDAEAEKWEKEKDKQSDLKDKVSDISSEMKGMIADKNDSLQEMMDDDPNIKIAQSFELQITRLQNAIDGQEDPSKTMMTTAATAAQKQKELVDNLTRTGAETLDKLSAMKRSMKRDTDLLDNANNTFNNNMSNDRPEDFHKFNIMIEFNGHVHKVLTNCELIGHSHAIMQGGEPIKESYSFLAQRID